MIKIRGKVDLNKMVKKIVDEITNDAFDELKTRTPRDSGRAAEGWNVNRGRGVNTITNSVPYISELDKGSSSQAPMGMTKPTIETLRANAKSGKYKRK